MYYDMWRDYFNNHRRKDKIEEMYQAFKERLQAEAEGETLEHTLEELEELEARHEAEEHYSQYLTSRYYRKAHAEKKGYSFVDYPYDPKRKYKK